MDFVETFAMVKFGFGRAGDRPPGRGAGGEDVLMFMVVYLGL